MAQSNTAGHTPLPWKILGDTAVIRDLGNVIGETICETEDTSSFTQDEDVNAANATLIVRAVNSHDELLAALKRMVAAHEDLQSNTDGRYPPAHGGCPECTVGTVPNRLNTGLCAYHAAHAAIAKAQS